MLILTQIFTFQDAGSTISSNRAHPSCGALPCVVYSIKINFDFLVGLIILSIGFGTARQE